MLSTMRRGGISEASRHKPGALEAPHPYGIKPKLLRIGGDVVRGYVREDFGDAWRRYLPPAIKAVTSVTDVARDER